MTHPKYTDLLPVTTADRKAAADIYEQLLAAAELGSVPTGASDPIVQAFARHRISHASVAREDDVERVAKAIAIADVPLPNETAWANDDFLSETGRQNYRVQARAAILALLPASPAQAVDALNGYRAAISYISADSWDGCSDCIEILKAARTADLEWDWAHDPSRIAAELKKIRPFCNRDVEPAQAVAPPGWRMVPEKWTSEMHSAYHNRDDYAKANESLKISDWWPHFLEAAALTTPDDGQSGEG